MPTTLCDDIAAVFMLVRIGGSSPRRCRGHLERRPSGLRDRQGGGTEFLPFLESAALVHPTSPSTPSPPLHLSLNNSVEFVVCERRHTSVAGASSRVSCPPAIFMPNPDLEMPHHSSKTAINH